jgi:transposase
MLIRCLRRFAEGIMTPLIIRRDRTAEVLRKLAKAEADARVARRLLAIANALSGMNRKEAAEAAGMDRQTLRDWVIRYNTHGLDGLYDCWGDGRPPRLDPQEQAELMRTVLAGPDPERDGLSAFTREDLVRICEARFGKTFHPASMGRLLKRLGFSRQKARPSHPQKDPAQAEAFKRGSSASRKHSAYAQR